MVNSTSLRASHRVSFFRKWAPNPSVDVQLYDFSIIGNTNVLQQETIGCKNLRFPLFLHPLLLHSLPCVVFSLEQYKMLIPYSQQFRSLNQTEINKRVKAIRAGEKVEILAFDIMVGDILLLEKGDLIPADGIVLESFALLVDESSMTVESDMIEK